jgi:serine/threonine protein phosphatase 1
MNTIKFFLKNTLGRDLIVGDIHGAYGRLAASLSAIDFDCERDRLFSVGDLVDKGPDSHAVLDWLDKPWFHPVQGNHDDMAVRWAAPGTRMDVQLYTQNGGAWNIGNTPAERVMFGDALDALPLGIEIETAAGLVGVVHADCPTPTWAEFRDALASEATSKTRLKALRECARWSRERIEAGLDTVIPDLRALVVGHTVVPGVVTLGNVHFIETGGWLSRPGASFTFFDAATLKHTTVRFGDGQDSEPEVVALPQS